jgi:hypothetical protein
MSADLKASKDRFDEIYFSMFLCNSLCLFRPSALNGEFGKASLDIWRD